MFWWSILSFSFCLFFSEVSYNIICVIESPLHHFGKLINWIYKYLVYECRSMGRKIGVNIWSDNRLLLAISIHSFNHCWLYTKCGLRYSHDGLAVGFLTCVLPVCLQSQRTGAYNGNNPMLSRNTVRQISTSDILNVTLSWYGLVTSRWWCLTQMLSSQRQLATFIPEMTLLTISPKRVLSLASGWYRKLQMPFHGLSMGRIDG